MPSARAIRSYLLRYATEDIRYYRYRKQPTAKRLRGGRQRRDALHRPVNSRIYG